ncbi:MAG: zinc chelation protein SecC [Variovorax paradoxus]|uniref:Zinc chelation protein SecC n=1 Tax=Variovorax paradoxus TaxID=34073 RepID=A0A2W5NSB3_VARPD|nr:MAG: zinc chelation protein SecC [Variovorax paradoxus]
MTAPSDAPPSAAEATLPPLEPEDFDALDDALDAMREHDEDVPQWEFCDGFMTALVCTRRPIEKRRWHEIQAALDAPNVEALDDERAFQPECLDLRGAIAALPPEERAEAPEAEIPSFGQVWALGFLAAVEQWSDDWTPPRDKDVAAMLADALEAIEVLASDDTAPPALSMYSEDGPPTVSQERLDDFGEAIWAVYDLRQLWRSLGPRVEALRKADEPGRNDPCPCGSGKKYKKCHGA